MTTESDINEIKSDIKEIKANLAEHMTRTALNEQRINQAEGHIKESTDVLKLVIDQGDKAADRNLKIIKLCIGIFAGLASLIGAYAAFMK